MKVEKKENLSEIDLCESGRNDCESERDANKSDKIKVKGLKIKVKGGENMLKL